MVPLRTRPTLRPEQLRGYLVGVGLSVLGTAMLIGSVYLASSRTAKLSGVVLGLAFLVFGALFYRWSGRLRPGPARPLPVRRAPRAARASAAQVLKGAR